MNKGLLLALVILLGSCATNPGIQPLDRGEEYRNYKGVVVFKVPNGENWYEATPYKGIISFGKKLESKDHTFVASAHITKVSKKFNSTDEFLSFVKQSRAQDFTPSRFNILKNNEEIDHTISEYCTKFNWEAEEKGKGILESWGYSCLHPRHSDLAVTIQYSERTKSSKVGKDILEEGEQFINSLELR